MKLLIITQKVDVNDPILGFFHQWITEFSKQVESLIVICLYEGQHSFPSNVKVLSLGKEKGNGRVGYLANLARFLWRERKSYDQVFVHMNQIYIVLAGLWWRLTGKKIGFWYVHKSVSFSLRIAVILTHVIFTATKDSFRIPSKKIRVVGHGIDTDLFSPKSADNVGQAVATFTKERPLKIVTIGRISKVKGYGTLIEAIHDLTKKKLSTDLTIVGGPVTEEDLVYEKTLKEKVAGAQLQEIIHFTGPVANKDIIQYLRRSDLFVNLSATGGLDKAVLEAMAVEVLVITSNETFTDVLTQYGLMSKPEDVGDLVETIEAMYNNPTRLKETGRKLRNWVIERHQLIKLIPKILSLYK